MTNDNFTEAARAEAERRYNRIARRNKTADEWLDEGRASGFTLGAEWARTHLAVAVELLAPAAAEHWSWSERQRARHGDKGCICTTCELFHALSAARRDEETR